MAGQQAAIVGPDPKLVQWLVANHVHYELRQHATTITSLETARVEHIDPATFAKAVGIVCDDGSRGLFVLDADDHVDLLKARRLYGGQRVRLMTEAELSATCLDCEVGATPAVGQLFDLPTFVDDAIRHVPAITFHAGSHQFTVLVDRSDWERATHARYADLAEHRTIEPAWMRS